MQPATRHRTKPLHCLYRHHSSAASAARTLVQPRHRVNGAVNGSGGQYKPSHSNLRSSFRHDQKHLLPLLDRLDYRPSLPITHTTLNKLLAKQWGKYAHVTDRNDSKALTSSAMEDYCTPNLAHYSTLFPLLSIALRNQQHGLVVQCYLRYYQSLVKLIQTGASEYSPHHSAFSKLTSLAIQSLTHTVADAKTECSKVLQQYETMLSQCTSADTGIVASIMPYAHYVKALCRSRHYQQALSLIDSSNHPTLVQSMIVGLAANGEQPMIVELIRSVRQSLTLPIIHTALTALTCTDTSTRTDSHTLAMAVLSLALEANLQPTAYTYALLCHRAYHSSVTSVEQMLDTILNDSKLSAMTDTLVSAMAALCAQYGLWNRVLAMLAALQYNRKLHSKHSHQPFAVAASTSNENVSVSGSGSGAAVKRQYRGPSWKQLVNTALANNDNTLTKSVIDHYVLKSMKDEIQYYRNHSHGGSGSGRLCIVGSESYNKIVQLLASSHFSFRPHTHTDTNTNSVNNVPPVSLFVQVYRYLSSDRHSLSYHSLCAMIGRCGEYNQWELMWQLYKQARFRLYVRTVTNAGTNALSQSKLYLALLHSIHQMDNRNQLATVTDLLHHHTQQSVATRGSAKYPRLPFRVYFALYRCYLHHRDYQGLFAVLTKFHRSPMRELATTSEFYCYLFGQLEHHSNELLTLLIKHVVVDCQRLLTAQELASINSVRLRDYCAETNVLCSTEGIDLAIQQLARA